MKLFKLGTLHTGIPATGRLYSKKTRFQFSGNRTSSLNNNIIHTAVNHQRIMEQTNRFYTSH